MKKLQLYPRDLPNKVCNIACPVLSAAQAVLLAYDIHKTTNINKYVKILPTAHLLPKHLCRNEETVLRKLFDRFFLQEYERMGDHMTRVQALQLEPPWSCNGWHLDHRANLNP